MSNPPPGCSPTRNSPYPQLPTLSPITPYHPAPRYHLDQLVTPVTIIPTCYFRVQSIQYDSIAQTHYYKIRTVTQFGDHWQPDLVRTEPEEVLQSREERQRRFNRDPSTEDEETAEASSGESVRDQEGNDDDSDELLEMTNRFGLGTNISRVIEVGDLVNVRVSSRGVKWVPGMVVGTRKQEGLWSCWLVELERAADGDRLDKVTIPCTQRLVKLVKKGSVSARKKLLARIAAKDVGAESRLVRVAKPMYARMDTGFQQKTR